MNKVLQWLKENKWKVIVPVLVIGILAFAFWYGGDAPSSRGWTVDTPTAPSGTAAPTENTVTTPSTEASQPEETQEVTQPVTKPEETEVPTEPQPTEPKPTEPKPTDPKPTEPKPTEPMPTEPPATEPPKTEPKNTCTISISCKTILNNMELCDPDKVELVPADGWILRTVTVEFTPGETVFDILQRVCKENRIHMSSRWTPMYGSAYIEGIHNLYEFDVGALSGWMYKVNGWFPNYGCSKYEVQNGDEICWVYTCDLGDDIGGSNALG